MNALNPYLRVFELPIVFFFSSLCFPESKNGPSLTNVDEKRKRGNRSHDAQKTARKKTTQKRGKLAEETIQKPRHALYRKFETSIPRNEKGTALFPISTFIHLPAFYIFQRSVCLFCNIAFAERSREYINSSQIHDVKIGNEAAKFHF
jgi:hypothetical protein